MNGEHTGCLVGPLAALVLALSWRVVRCPVCSGSDCWWTVGGLCNQQRAELPSRWRPEQSESPPPPPEPDPRQLSLFARGDQ